MGALMSMPGECGSRPRFVFSRSVGVLIDDDGDVKVFVLGAWWCYVVSLMDSAVILFASHNTVCLYLHDCASDSISLLESSTLLPV